MKEKQCFRCKEVKPLSEFYSHKQMADGHLGKCKECTKSDVAKNYQDKAEKYAAYEKERNQRPERMEKKRTYNSTARKRYPLKRLCRVRTTRLIESGELKPRPCNECGAKEVQAHHIGYIDPTDILWLCHECHCKVHGRQARGNTPLVNISF